MNQLQSSGESSCFNLFHDSNALLCKVCLDILKIFIYMVLNVNTFKTTLKIMLQCEVIMLLMDI